MDLAEQIVREARMGNKWIRKWAAEKIQQCWREHNYTNPFRCTYKCMRCWDTFRSKDEQCHNCDEYGSIAWTDARRRDDAKVNDIIRLKNGTTLRVKAIDVDISGMPGIKYVQWVLYVGEDAFGITRHVNELAVFDVER